MSVYAREQPAFLHECLSSLHAQTVPADEIVIVLDGKIGADLHAVLDDWANTLPLHIVPLPENVGLGHALNHGLAHCSCDWVMRMDSDDIATPTRLAQQRDYLCRQPHIGLLGGQIAEFDGQPAYSHAIRQVPLTHDEIVVYAKKRNPFNHMTIAYRKSLVQQAGGYRHHQAMEDYNLWLRMLAQGVQAANLPEILVHARTGNSMIVRRRGWAYVRSEWQLYRLKRQLGIQCRLPALLTLAQRALPRLLPAFLLQHLYIWLRKR